MAARSGDRRLPAQGLWALALGLLLAWTAARGFREPGSYAEGQWLLSYDQGLVRRGLVGTAIRPWLWFKSAGEITLIIQTVSLLALTGVYAGFLGALRRGSPERPRPHEAAFAVAAATSGWVVYAAHANGYFDRFHELATLACVALVGTRARYAVVPVLVVLGIATHEGFVVYGLPAVLFATVLSARDTRTGLRDAGLLVGLAVTVVFVLFRATSALSEASLEALRGDVVRSGLFRPDQTDSAVFQLTDGSFAVVERQIPKFLDRISEPDTLAVMLPMTLLAWVWTGLRLSGRSRLWLAAIPVCALPPLALHLVAWDTPRFTLMVVFQSVMLWAATVRYADSPALGTTARNALTAVGAAVAISHVFLPVPLLAARIDGDGVLAIRDYPNKHTFVGCRSAFHNASFEGGLAGWTVSDEVVRRNLRKPKPGRRLSRRPEGVHREHYLSTWGRHEVRGTAATMTLTSPQFRITEDLLLGRIAGGVDLERLHVRLMVGDTEVARATGTGGLDLEPFVWDVSGFRGQRGVLVIEDQATGEWGHLSVDHFCLVSRYHPGG